MRESREYEHTTLTYLLLYAGIGALTTPGEVKRHSMDIASLSWLRRDDKRVAAPRSPPLFDGFLLTAARFALRGMLTIGSLTAMDAIARPSSLGSIMTRGRRRRRGGVREGGHVTLEEAMNYKVPGCRSLSYPLPPSLSSSSCISLLLFLKSCRSTMRRLSFLMFRWILRLESSLTL